MKGDPGVEGMDRRNRADIHLTIPNDSLLDRIENKLPRGLMNLEESRNPIVCPSIRATQTPIRAVNQ
jgi:hypothetical protein